MLPYRWLHPHLHFNILKPDFIILPLNILCLPCSPFSVLYLRCLYHHLSHHKFKVSLAFFLLSGSHSQPITKHYWFYLQNLSYLFSHMYLLNAFYLQDTVLGLVKSKALTISLFFELRVQRKRQMVRKKRNKCIYIKCSKRSTKRLKT